MEYFTGSLATAKKQLARAVILADAIERGETLQGLGTTGWQTLSPSTVADLLRGPMWHYCAYRIKPTLVQYRLALWQNSTGMSVECMTGPSMEHTEERMHENYSNFVRWLGDVQEVES